MDKMKMWNFIIYTPQQIIRVITSRSIKLSTGLILLAEIRNTYRISV
jgi:hypothetical protein